MRRFTAPTALSVLAIVVAPLAPAFATDVSATPATVTSPAAQEPPAAPASTDRVIVQFTEDTTAAEQRQVLAETVRQSDAPGAAAAAVAQTGDTTQVLELGQDVAVEELTELTDELSASPEVLYAGPDQMLTSQWKPNDLNTTTQWGPGAAQLQPAWDVSTGAGTVIGVVDSGLALHHDVSSKAIGGYDFVSSTDLSNDVDRRDADYTDPGNYAAANQCWIDPSTGAGNRAMNSTWHGTHVAGVAAAVTGNGAGIAGAAPGADLLVARATGACDAGYTSDIADSIRWLAGDPVTGVPAAPETADVISISLGGIGTCDPLLQSAINTAVSNGVPVVVAAGNDSVAATQSMPANCNNVIAVGASTRDNKAAWFSNHGSAVDVWAPGMEILSTYNDGRTTAGAQSLGYLSGTSQAAPHVTGVVALLKEQNPSLTPAQIEAKLKSTATAKTAGVPVVNAAAALGANTAPTYATKGAIGRYYERIKTTVGAPIANEVSIAGGAKQEFEKGTIYWSSATGAQLVKGGIRFTFDRNGGTATIGFPVAGEKSNGIGGAYQSFQKGKILWSSKTGARALRGAIGSRYSAMGNEKGALGYPTADEKPNGIGGSYQVFQKGKILWSSKTGAHALKGAIATRYNDLGNERGRLGYPTSGEYSSAGKTRQNYQGGFISWSSRTGAVVTFR